MPPGPADLGHAAPATQLGTRARTALTMIVNHEQDNLPNCLSTVAGLFRAYFLAPCPPALKGSRSTLKTPSCSSARPSSTARPNSQRKLK